MKYSLLKFTFALVVAITLTSCSLLKVSVNTGEPLKKEDINARLMTRGFYYEMSAEIAKTADSIISSANSTPIKLRAIQWKISATRAAVSAAMQSIPEVAMVDTWILCCRMNTSFKTTPDALLFGKESSLARATAQKLNNKIEALAKETLTHDRFALMSKFVEQYIIDNPSNADTQHINTTLAWVNYLKDNGVEHMYSIGTISEVLSDMGDKVGGQTQQISNSVGWTKDMIEIRMSQDSLRSKIEMQLDSLEGNFRRMVVVMEHIPQISDTIINGLNAHVGRIIYTLNSGVDNVFMNINTQRDELQRFISDQRQVIIDQAQQAANETVQQAIDKLPAMIAKLMIYIVIFAVIMLGTPFLLGFWLGKYRERVAKKRSADK